MLYLNQVQALSCIRQDRQTEPRVNTHCSPNFGIFSPDWGSNPQPVALTVTLWAPAPRRATFNQFSYICW